MALTSKDKKTVVGALVDAIVTLTSDTDTVTDSGVPKFQPGGALENLPFKGLSYTQADVDAVLVKVKTAIETQSRIDGAIDNVTEVMGAVQRLLPLLLGAL